MTGIPNKKGMQRRYKGRLFIVMTVLVTLCAQGTFFASPLIFGKKSYFDKSVMLPILMYHELTEKGKVSNKWMITPEEFEADLIYMKENGYEAVTMAQLVKFVNKKGKLPKKPVVLTFDDGLSGVYDYAYPLLKKYKMKAVLAIIGDVTDEYSKGGPEDTRHYPHLTWAQINEMVSSGLVELQNHSYAMHRSIGAKKRGGESRADYKNRLAADLNMLQERMSAMTKSTATTFVYPFGAVSKESKDVLREIGFSASLGCYDIINKVTPGQPECLFDLGRTLRAPGSDTEQIFKRFAEAIAAGEKAEEESESLRNNKPDEAGESEADTGLGF